MTNFGNDITLDFDHLNIVKDDLDELACPKHIYLHYVKERRIFFRNNSSLKGIVERQIAYNFTVKRGNCLIHKW